MATKQGGANGGKPSVDREIDGLLLLDKPGGISSNHALQAVKRLLGADKAGHTGALDPLATGMLPLCFGEATRLAGLLLGADKAYLSTARLGARSTTGDSEGVLLEQRAIPALDRTSIEAVLRRFRGDIDQIPPMYSALKQQGQTLYKLARQGIEVERPPRRVHIYKLELLAITADTLRLEVECSKGTYIRSLVEDIGEALGCGAHVCELRRSWIQGFQGQRMYSLDELRAMSPEQLGDCVLPTLAGLGDTPRLRLNTAQEQKLRHGQPLFVEYPAIDRLAILGTEQQLLAVANIDSQGRVSVQARFDTRRRLPGHTA